MNIFEFLGLDHKHRAENKIFQYVKHYADVNPKSDQGILHKKVSFPMYAQSKKDGVFAAVVIDCGTCKIFNRTGKRMTNVALLEQKFEDLMIEDGVYLGELCNEYCSLEVLSGIVNPNRVKDLSTEQGMLCESNNIFFFDFIDICEFITGRSDKIFRSRFKRLYKRLSHTNLDFLTVSVVSDEEELQAYAQRAIDNGQEGAVFKQDVEWLAGAKDWHQMKIVRGIHVDLECIGYEEGTGKYEGLVANLLFRYKNGLIVKAMLGKGWTHTDARQMFLDLHPLCDKNPIGKIFHVYGLQESSKGIIRLPKVSEMRHDKTEPDF